MKDKIFVDSNVFVYLLSNDERKKSVALEILSAKPVISVQVINENINAALKKLKLPHHEAISHTQTLMKVCVVKPIHKRFINTAISILNKLPLFLLSLFNYCSCT